MKNSLGLSLVFLLLAVVLLSACANTDSANSNSTRGEKKKSETNVEAKITNAKYPQNVSWDEVKLVSAQRSFVNTTMEQREGYVIDIANFEYKPDPNGGDPLGLYLDRKFPTLQSNQALLELLVVAPRNESFKAGKYPEQGSGIVVGADPELARQTRNEFLQKPLGRAVILFNDGSSTELKRFSEGFVEITGFDGNTIKGNFRFSDSDLGSISGNFVAPIVK